MLKALLPNPWVLLGLLALWAGSTSFAYLKGVSEGRQDQRSEQQTLEAATAAFREAAQQGAADEIAKIKITNTTIHQKMQREVYTDVVYRDCRHTPDGLRAINQAITGKPDPAPESVVRGAGPATRQLFRGDKPQAGRVGKQP